MIWDIALAGSSRRHRALAGEHFIEHQTEAENIAPCVGSVPLKLFRGHVVEGSEDLTGPRVFDDRLVACAHSKYTVHLCQPEIEQHDSVFCDEDVGWFEITVSDTCVMRFKQGAADLDSICQCSPERQGS